MISTSTQYMVLATRPLLVCFLKIRLESLETCLKNLSESETAHTLMQICLDSSLQMTMILEALQSQGILGEGISAQFMPIVCLCLVSDHRALQQKLSCRLISSPFSYPQSMKWWPR